MFLKILLYGAIVVLSVVIYKCCLTGSKLRRVNDAYNDI